MNSRHLNCRLHIFAAGTLTPGQSPQSCTCIFDYDLSRDAKGGMFYLFYTMTQSLLYFFTISVLKSAFKCSDQRCLTGQGWRQDSDEPRRAPRICAPNEYTVHCRCSSTVFLDASSVEVLTSPRVSHWAIGQSTILSHQV